MVEASNWEQLKHSARLGDLAAVAFGALGIVTGVLAAFGHSPMVPVGVVFCLLCAHAVTFAIACRNQARLQAAFDMKRMAASALSCGPTTFAAGSELQVTSTVRFRFYDATRVEVILT